MTKRLGRDLQVERNRQLVLKAARRVFLEKGYAGASLDAIVEEAGFSKGVVYSQFESKADLFLALLERRISERADENERVAAETAGAAGVAEGLGVLIRLAQRNFVEEPEWALLVAEFRVQAARDPQLNRRYAEVHARTIARLSRLLARIHERAGLEPAFETVTLAEFILALGIGMQIERTANPRALPLESLVPMLSRALGAALPDMDRSERGATRRRGQKAVMS
jgi:AcrR family transcriptional regulator